MAARSGLRYRYLKSATRLFAGGASALRPGGETTALALVNTSGAVIDLRIGSTAPAWRLLHAALSSTVTRSADGPVPFRSAGRYVRTTRTAPAWSKGSGVTSYAGPTPSGASFATGTTENAVGVLRTPAGTFSVNRPSVERIDPPCDPIVAEDGMSTGSGMMPVTTAPASADIRNESSDAGFCWAP